MVTKTFRQSGIDFGPGDETADQLGGNANRFGDFTNQKPTIPMVELPNYLLSTSRNRVRAVVLFSRQAIGSSKEEGLRRNLDAKAEGLARVTVSELNSLLKKSEVGLLNREERRDPDAPPMEEEDQNRQQSYADQMTQILEGAALELGKVISEFTTEPAAAAPAP